MRYCTLCGIPITQKLHEPWLKEFRAVWIENDNWDVVRLSGVGICDEFDDVVTGTVPVHPHKHYNDSLDPDSMMEVALITFNLDDIADPETTGEPEPWGFGFHSSCWSLFNTEFTPNLGLLFQTCLSMPLGVGSIMDWGHDYGGAAIADRASEIPRLASRFSDWNSIPKDMQSDPFNVPNLARAIRQAARLQDDAFQSHLSLDRYNREGDKFSRLSPELLQIIATILPSHDVRSLRLASPVFATLSLPEKFWASRFDGGNEFAHVPEAFHNPPESWRTLYLSLQTWTSGNPNMDNRKRVWGLVKRLQLTLGQMEGVSCEGSPLKTWFESPVSDESSLSCETSQVDEGISWLTAARGIIDPAEDFVRGCRVLRARVLYFRKPTELQHMTVSFVDTPGGRFVSGLEFVDSDGQCHTIGYLHHDQNVQIKVAPSRCIRGWELALDMSGVRAVAIILEDGTRSSWAGEPADFPRWHLAEADGISTVKAEFDAMKLVSLSRSISQKPLAQRGWRNSCLWYPDVPPEGLLFNGSEGDQPPKLSDVPVKSLFFGGTDDRNLSSLIGIVIWVFDLYHIAGIEFLYADASQNQCLGQAGPFSDNHPAAKRFDSSQGRRIPFSIEGSGGEKPFSFEVQKRSGYLVGLKIRTNFGREVTSPQCPHTVDEQWTTVQPAGADVVGLFCNHTFFLWNLGLISTS
ncbi:hypothetical protein FDECE_10377 [Fusarium decemcellulare]|nr:hypothetical protein FDECE_10377 [Fusarium decemcellulare]